jgi:hypothetical protein
MYYCMKDWLNYQRPSLLHTVMRTRLRLIPGLVSWPNQAST